MVADAVVPLQGFADRLSLIGGDLCRSGDPCSVWPRIGGFVGPSFEIREAQR